MKNIKCLLTVVVLLTLATGCASTKQFVPFPDQNKSVGVDKTRIYVVRPTSIGCGVSMKVSDGGQLIGETGPKSYLCWERKPGAVEINSKAENTDTLSLDAQAGKAYYIQQHIRPGILYARNKLTLLNEAEGKELISKCSPAKK